MSHLLLFVIMEYTYIFHGDLLTIKNDLMNTYLIVKNVKLWKTKESFDENDFSERIGLILRNVIEKSATDLVYV